MLKITIEIWPWGIKENSRILGSAIIWNDGSGGRTLGNYCYKIFKEENSTPWKKGNIKNFERLKHGVWNLLYLVLKNVFVLDNKEKEFIK